MQALFCERALLVLLNMHFILPTHLFALRSPRGLKYICESAFSHSDILKEIVFEGTQEEWEAVEKTEGWDKYSDNYSVIFNDNHSNE